MPTPTTEEATTVTTYRVEHGVDLDLTVEPAGILGRERAVMLARLYGGEHVTRIVATTNGVATFGPWTAAE